VTGSARLDAYKAGGDSLMGRYFLYRLHPLSVGELIQSRSRQTEVSAFSKKISQKQFQNLFDFGGFPEPFIKYSKPFYTRWKRLRTQQLFTEDLRDLTKINDLGQMELLAELLQSSLGQRISVDPY
jgi:predicted AAA+ superfamily ATPase